MLLSAVIPTYKTPENALSACLLSLLRQDLADMEIIIVDDNDSAEESKKIKSMVKAFKKDKSLPHRKDIRIEGYGKNRGLVEARRLGIEKARGEYICFIDSDDELIGDDACSQIFKSAKEKGGGQDFDIIQFRAKTVRLGAYILEKNKDAYKLVEEPEESIIIEEDCDEFTKRYVTRRKIPLFLWSKFIRREKLFAAFQRIPRMNCFMSEDTLISFFLGRECNSYIGLSDVRYRYSIGKGISTSADKIDSMDRWRKLCTPSCAFTAILGDLQERPPKDSLLIDHYKKVMTYFVIRNIKVMNRVPKELHPQAHEILVESWGEDIISSTEAFLNSSQGQKLNLD